MVVKTGQRRRKRRKAIESKQKGKPQADRSEKFGIREGNRASGGATKEASWTGQFDELIIKEVVDRGVGETKEREVVEKCHGNASKSRANTEQKSKKMRRAESERYKNCMEKTWGKNEK